MTIKVGDKVGLISSQFKFDQLIIQTLKQTPNRETFSAHDVPLSGVDRQRPAFFIHQVQRELV